MRSDLDRFHFHVGYLAPFFVGYLNRVHTGPPCSTHTGVYCNARARLPQEMLRTLVREPVLGFDLSLLLLLSFDACPLLLLHKAPAFNRSSQLVVQMGRARI